ncbi:uncharacterized protein LOC121729478 [Aricia agestis]|uniref:uncharacterized protein LOC121729478 n=1 Tax=Aricia agestis TaxID=91739 RepID=UPI001C202C2B|nr:uncharacterized protein LOC121729478 [Aricia agestis]
MDNQEFDTEEEDDDVDQEETYEFNFINLPWDDRTKESKVLMISLLVSILLATFAVVINNVAIHYRNSDNNSSDDREPECNLVRVENYPFVARIYSFSPNKLICLGVVLSRTTILTGGLCMKFSPIYIKLGSTFNPRCKKGYSVDEMFYIPHMGALTKSLAVIITKDNLSECSESIPIGMAFNYEQDVEIIGKPRRSLKTLSLQLGIPTPAINSSETICVQGLERCPVRVSDVLIQENRFFGLGATSVHKREHVKKACFASIQHITNEITALDPKIKLAY